MREQFFRFAGVQRTWSDFSALHVFSFSLFTFLFSPPLPPGGVGGGSPYGCKGQAARGYLGALLPLVVTNEPLPRETFLPNLLLVRLSMSVLSGLKRKRTPLMYSLVSLMLSYFLSKFSQSSLKVLSKFSQKTTILRELFTPPKFLFSKDNFISHS